MAVFWDAVLCVLVSESLTAFIIGVVMRAPLKRRSTCARVHGATASDLRTLIVNAGAVCSACFLRIQEADDVRG